MEINDLSVMVGKTIVKASDAKAGAEVILFLMDDGSAYAFHHDQDCCETVTIEDVCGDIEDLIGSPLVQAEEVTSNDARPVDPFTGAQCSLEYEDSQTWTFYKFATVKGSVTIRWLGQSNGYYSESVALTVLRAGEPIPLYFLDSAPLALAAS